MWLGDDHVSEACSAVLGHNAVLRDRSLLQSGMARAKSAYAYMDASVFQAAAYYAAGVAANHPFADGNKRMGWALATLFLDLNGFQVEVNDARESTAMMVGLAKGTVSIDYMAGFLAGAARRVSPPSD